MCTVVIKFKMTMKRPISRIDLEKLIKVNENDLMNFRWCMCVCVRAAAAVELPGALSCVICNISPFIRIYANPHAVKCVECVWWRQSTNVEIKTDTKCYVIVFFGQRAVNTVYEFYSSLLCACDCVVNQKWWDVTSPVTPRLLGHIAWTMTTNTQTFIGCRSNQIIKKYFCKISSTSIRTASRAWLSTPIGMSVQYMKTL